MKANCVRCQKEYDVPVLVLNGSTKECHVCRNKAKAIWSARETDVSLTEKCRVAGIPQRYWTLQDTDEAKLARKVTLGAFTRDQPLFLHGPTRAGKTLCLTYFAKQLLSFGARVRYYHMSDLASKLRGNVRAGDELMRFLKTVAHVIIDDIGSEYDKSGFVTSWVMQLAENRYSSCQPLSGACNDIEAIDNRILRRFIEPAFVVRMGETK